MGIQAISSSSSSILSFFTDAKELILMDIAAVNWNAFWFGRHTFQPKSIWFGK